MAQLMNPELAFILMFIQSTDAAENLPDIESYGAHQQLSSTNSAERMRITSAGAIKFNSYGSGTHTGTSAYKLSVDSGGNIIETSIGSGAVDGAGTANYIPKWTDGDTIGNSTLYNSGSFVGISTASTIASSAELLAVYSASTGHTNLRNASDTYGTIYVRNLSTTASTYQPYIILSDGNGNRGGLGLEYSTSKLKVHGQGGVSFWTGAAFGGGTEKVIIASDGKVGIGTNAPVTTLDVNGVTTARDYIRLGASAVHGQLNVVIIVTSKIDSVWSVG